VPYQILSHTADTGIEATGNTFPDLVRDLAAGMFGLMAAPEAMPEGPEIEADVSGTTPEELVVDLLSELLYQSEVEELILGDFEVEMLGEQRLKVKAHGIPLSKVELTGPPIKAVTYHDVTISKTDEGWYGRVYFDV
jgi:SHS2 domain-containing protein